jgi:hypothetical protein
MTSRVHDDLQIVRRRICNVEISIQASTTDWWLKCFVLLRRITNQSYIHEQEHTTAGECLLPFSSYLLSSYLLSKQPWKSVLFE